MTDPLLDLINQVRTHADLPPVETLSAETHLRDDLGFDSLALAELTVRIEDTFEVDVFADGLVYTVGEIREKLDQLPQ